MKVASYISNKFKLIHTRFAFLFCLLLVVSSYSSAKAQGLTNESFREGEVLWSSKGVGHRVTAWLNGHWYIPGIEFNLLDIKNPRTPVVKHSSTIPWVNGHNYCVINGKYFLRQFDIPEAEEGAYSGGKRFIDITKFPQIVSTTGGLPKSIYNCVTASLYPYSNNTIDDKASPYGLIFRDDEHHDLIVIGNLAIYTYASGNTFISEPKAIPILAFDISDPSNPKLLDSFTPGFANYTSSAKVYKHYLVFQSREGKDITLNTVDFSDPTNLKKGFSIDGFRGRYIQFQDEFGFGNTWSENGNGDQLVKANFETQKIVGRWQTNNPYDMYPMPVGHTVLISGSQGNVDTDQSTIIAHQSLPDTRAPFVAYHLPKANSVNNGTKTRIGIIIHETLEATTVSSDNIILKPLNGEPVETLISYKDNDVINISPLAELKDDTTYEVVLRRNGVEDAAGNGIEDFSFKFSTGSEIEGVINTPIPTSTPIPPKPTSTPLPPTPTSTPIPPSPTNTPVRPKPTSTQVPPAPTIIIPPPVATSTPLPPIFTSTPLPSPTVVSTPEPTAVPTLEPTIVVTEVPTIIPTIVSDDIPNNEKQIEEFTSLVGQGRRLYRNLKSSRRFLKSLRDRILDSKLANLSEISFSKLNNNITTFYESILNNKEIEIDARLLSSLKSRSLSFIDKNIEFSKAISSSENSQLLKLYRNTLKREKKLLKIVKIVSKSVKRQLRKLRRKVRLLNSRLK